VCVIVFVFVLLSSSVFVGLTGSEENVLYSRTLPSAAVDVRTHKPSGEKEHPWKKFPSPLTSMLCDCNVISSAEEQSFVTTKEEEDAIKMSVCLRGGIRHTVPSTPQK
jgi:hypothetical protein